MPRLPVALPLALLCAVGLAASAAAQQAKEPDIYLTKPQWEEQQKILSEKAAAGQHCHIEYRNCWVDIEYRCHPPDVSGGTVVCEQTPVRRCGPPDTVCN